jgi:hypothetical protein
VAASSHRPKDLAKKPNYAAYLGRYHDTWLGDVTIFTQGNQHRIFNAGAFAPSP